MDEVSASSASSSPSAFPPHQHQSDDAGAACQVPPCTITVDTRARSGWVDREIPGVVRDSAPARPLGGKASRLIAQNHECTSPGSGDRIQASSTELIVGRDASRLRSYEGSGHTHVDAESKSQRAAGSDRRIPCDDCINRGIPVDNDQDNNGRLLFPRACYPTNHEIPADQLHCHYIRRRRSRSGSSLKGGRLTVHHSLSHKKLAELRRWLMSRLLALLEYSHVDSGWLLHASDQY